MNKDKRNKIIFSIILIVALFLVSLLIGCIATSLILNESLKLDFITLISYVPNELTLTITFIVFAAFMAFIIYTALKYKFFSFNKMVNRVDRAKSDLYGQASFMTKEEMTKKYGQKDESSKKVKYYDYNFGTLKSSNFNGYIVNSYKLNSQLYCNCVSKMHGLVIGTNGSGKSLYFLSPTLQANARSSDNHKPTLIINDLKGELYNDNSQILKENGYNIIVLNLRDPSKSTKFNPLDLIWDLYHEYMESVEENRKRPTTPIKYELLDKVSAYILEMATTICPTSTGDNASWSQGSQGILAGIMWALLEDSLIPEYNMTKSKFTLQQIANVINRYKDSLQDFLKNRPKSSPVWDYCSMIIDNESEKTMASYISYTQTSLRPLIEPGIQRITCTSDFDLIDIVKKPTALFLIIPDEQKSRYVLANLIIAQIYNFLTYYSSQQPNLTLDRTVYYMLDEFGNMPKLPQFPNWISTSRSRNIFFCIIVQAISQLNSVYGNDETKTILQNCHFQMFLGATEETTLEYFTKMLGTYTIYSRNASLNEKNLNSIDYQGSTSLVKKELVNKDQLQYIKRGEVYFTVSREKPCHASLVPFFDSELQKRGIFKKGNAEISYRATITNPNDLVFDVENRTIVYQDLSQNISPSKKTTNKSGPENTKINELEDDGLKDVTFLYNESQEQVTNEVTDLDNPVDSQNYEVVTIEADTKNINVVPQKVIDEICEQYNLNEPEDVKENEKEIIPIKSVKIDPKEYFNKYILGKAGKGGKKTNENEQ